MAKTKALDPNVVVYLAPETLNQAELAERLAAVDDPAEALEILNSRPTTGEYREFLGNEIGEGPEGTTVIVPAYGELVQWVDENPDDLEDPAGHFEQFGGTIEEYKPTRRAE